MCYSYVLTLCRHVINMKTSTQQCVYYPSATVSNNETSIRDSEVILKRPLLKKIPLYYLHSDILSSILPHPSNHTLFPLEHVWNCFM